MVYRVCYRKATKQIIEMQSGGDTPEHLQTLIDNAINSGWDEKDITCEYMDDKQYMEAQAADPNLTAEKSIAKGKADKVAAAKVNFKALIAAQDADKSKVSLSDVLDRLTLIETILNLR